MRRILHGGCACVLVVACGRAAPVDAPPSPHGVPATVGGNAAADDPYRAFVFPPTDRPWTIADYQATRDTLIAIEQQAPDLLVHAAGPRAAVFAALCSLEGASRVAKAAKLDAMIDLGDALATTMKLYIGRVAKGEAYGPEYIAMTVAYLHVAALQFAAIERGLGLDVAALRRDRVRLEGLLKMRYGLRLAFASAIRSALEVPALVSAGDLADGLRPIVGELVPLLLPEEVTAIRGLVAKLADAGASAAQVAALDRALAVAVRRPPLVADLLEEHRAFSRERDELVAAVIASALAPVELGREGGGTRYAMPDRSMSAIFDVPPNAQLHTTNEDGIESTLRTLGIRDATGFTRSVVCITRDSGKPPEAFAQTVLAGMKAKDIVAATSSGHPGFEGTVRTATTQAIVRVIERGTTGCIVTTEFPPRIADAAKPRARAFIDSVRFDPPKR